MTTIAAASMSAQTKVRNKTYERRVVFLSWVEDEPGLAYRCVSGVWTKLKGVSRDRYETPFSTRNPNHERIAGEITSAPSLLEDLKDVTDVIAFLTDEYMSIEPHVSSMCEMSAFVQRKLAEQAGRSESDDDAGGLAMWMLLVQKMDLDYYALTAGQYKTWWHPLLEHGERLWTEGDKESQFRDQMHEAAMRLLGHHRTQCARCRGMEEHDATVLETTARDHQPRIAAGTDRNDASARRGGMVSDWLRRLLP